MLGEVSGSHFIILTTRCIKLNKIVKEGSNTSDSIILVILAVLYMQKATSIEKLIEASILKYTILRPSNTAAPSFVSAVYYLVVVKLSVQSESCMRKLYS